MAERTILGEVVATISKGESDNSEPTIIIKKGEQSIEIVYFDDEDGENRDAVFDEINMEDVDALFALKKANLLECF